MHSGPCTSHPPHFLLATSTRRARLNALTLSDLHRRLVVNGRGSHPFLDLAGHGQEGLLDVRGVLGRGLEEGYAEAVRKLLHTSISSGSPNS